MTATFGSAAVDASGSTAIRIRASTARVDADVVPCFDYKYYFASGTTHEGAKTVRKDGTGLVNYPTQHRAKGKAKNNATNTCFKKTARILKRVENAMLTAGTHREVPSYFVECLVDNCPVSACTPSTWTETVKLVLGHIWANLDGAEPTDAASRWLEVNECKYLFSSAQKWSRRDGREFAFAAWNYLGLAS